MYPNEYPITLAWEEEDLGEEKEEEDDKEEEYLSVCSEWDADLEEQNKKHREIEDQKNKNRKTPKTGPDSSSVDTLTHSPSESFIKQFGNQSSMSPETEVEVPKFDTLPTLPGHEKQKH